MHLLWRAARALRALKAHNTLRINTFFGNPVGARPLPPGNSLEKPSELNGTLPNSRFPIKFADLPDTPGSSNPDRRELRSPLCRPGPIRWLRTVVPGEMAS